MATNANSAQGAKKTQPASKKEPVAPKAGFKPIKKENVNTTNIFEITGGGIVATIKSDVSVYDRESEKVRHIRYCPGEHTIYREEQNPNSRREHIIFYDGMLVVPEDKPNLFEFLMKHPDNKANGGAMFNLIDRTTDAKKIVEDEFLVHDAVALVRSKSSDEILSVAVSLGIDIGQQMIDIRRDLLREAKANPSAFIQMFDDPRVKTRSAVIQADEFQIISCRPDGAYWFDSGRLIVSVPAGQDAVDILVRFCLTEKGAAVYEEIVARLAKIS